jgi:hypothetical protein
VSELGLYTWGKWYIKFRITAPKDSKNVNQLFIDKFFRLIADGKKSYRDRDAPHRAPLPHHAAYGSILRGSADQAESDPGEHKPK